MKQLVTIFFFILSFFIYSQNPDIRYNDFYAIISNTNLVDINNNLTKIYKSDSNSRNQVYKAVLLIKKSSIIKNPSDKIQLFNQGKSLLENEIRKDSNNVEFRFLRLIIQENAPPILKYSNNITNDKLFIENNFKKACLDLQKIIIDYSKQSIILNINELN